MGFKERLKEKRLEAGLTQAELAEKVSVTARTIQNYEMGSRKPGNMKVVGDIATVLGTMVLALRPIRKSSSESQSRGTAQYGYLGGHTVMESASN